MSGILGDAVTAIEWTDVAVSWIGTAHCNNVPQILNLPGESGYISNVPTEVDPHTKSTYWLCLRWLQQQRRPANWVGDTASLIFLDWYVSRPSFANRWRLIWVLICERASRRHGRVASSGPGEGKREARTSLVKYSRWLMSRAARLFRVAIGSWHELVLSSRGELEGDRRRPLITSVIYHINLLLRSPLVCSIVKQFNLGLFIFGLLCWNVDANSNSKNGMSCHLDYLNGSINCLFFINHSIPIECFTLR